MTSVSVWAIAQYIIKKPVCEYSCFGPPRTNSREDPLQKKHKCNNLSNYLSMCLSISVSTLLWLYTNGFADMSTKWGDIILYNYSSLNSIVLYEATLCRRI